MNVPLVIYYAFLGASAGIAFTTMTREFADHRGRQDGLLLAIVLGVLAVAVRPF